METGKAIADNRAPGFLQNPALHALIKSFIKYVLVGGLAFVVDFGTFSTMLNFGAHYQLATVSGFVVGILTNYALCVSWVWRGSQARSLRDILIFTIVGLGGLGLTSLGMWVGVGLLHAPERATRIVMAALVLIWNFGLRRFFVFFR